MREIDNAQAAELLGYSRSYFVDRVSKSERWRKTVQPSTKTSRKNVRWPLEAVLRFKAGK